MIELTDVSKRFITAAETVVAVDQINLTISTGEFICVYGPSGSGKSTLINLLAGIETPDSGTIRVLHNNISSLSDTAREQFRITNIGLIFQDGNLFGEFTALENVMLPMLAGGQHHEDVQTIALEALERFDIKNLAQRFPQEMSGGQRQRVGVARAFACQQPVLLADEPTGSLDRKNSEALLHHFAELAHQHQRTVLVATHDPLAEKVADKVLWMEDGKINKD